MHPLSPTNMADFGIYENDLLSSAGVDAVLDVTTDVIKRLWKEVDHREFIMVYKSLFEEISKCINDGCLVHLNRLLSLLTTTLSQSSKNQIFGECESCTFSSTYLSFLNPYQLYTHDSVFSISCIFIIF